MRRSRGLASCVVGAAAVLAACASADKNADVDASHAADSHGSDDAAVVTSGDAGIDGPVAVTLSQNTGTTIGSANSVTCGNTDGTTAENSWYRVFTPSASGVTGVFHVEHVDFAAQEASGGEQVQVNVGTYAGAVGGANVHLIIPGNPGGVGQNELPE